MIQVVWQFVVKEEAVDRFERAYGPNGEWARLFARHPAKWFSFCTSLVPSRSPQARASEENLVPASCSFCHIDDGLPTM
ncbi:MAG: hypothetical protein WD690_08565 [Vicinamibacterales bacterium]